MSVMLSWQLADNQLLRSTCTSPGGEVGEHVIVGTSRGLNMQHVGPAAEPDKYRLAEMRSRGGEGEVWRGSLSVEGQDVLVAVKLILPGNVEALDEWRDRWRRQAEVLRSLSHPGVVTVREVFEGPQPHEPGAADPGTSTLCLVMNWAEGPTLSEWVARRPNRDVLESLAVIRNLAAAVDYLHSGADTGAPVVHRDIKPANVVITEAGPCLVDFGFVRGTGEGPPETMVGSPSYIAPEVAAGLGASEAADRFSLAATAYFALTGTAPDLSDIPGMRDHLAAVPGLEDRPDIHDHLLAMLHPDPTNRPGSSVDWAQGLAQLSVARVDDGATRVQTAPVATAAPGETADVVGPETGTGRRWWLVAAAVAGVALVGTAAAWALLDPGGEAVTASASTTPSEQGMTASPAAVEAAGGTPPPTPTPSPTVEPLEVPTVTGEDLASATASLEALGLVVESRSQPVAGPVDVVLEQDPAGGEEIAAGGTVVLSVSEAVPTPDLVGMSRDQAEATLGDLEVNVDVERRYVPDSEIDQVIEQSVPASEPLPEDVTLTVAQGPATLFLEQLNPVDSNGFYGEEAIELDGKVYPHSLVTRSMRDVWNAASSDAEFNLSRDFSRLQALLGYGDTGSADGVIRIEIFGDGQTLASEDVALGTTVPIDVEVTGVLRLKVIASWLSGESTGNAALGDARLLGDPDVIAEYESEDG